MSTHTSGLKHKIESGFEQLGLTIYDNRFKTLLLLFIIIAAFFSQLPKMSIDTSNEGFLHADDPILQTYNQFRDQFGRDEVILLAIQSENIFSDPFMRKLQNLHQELEDNLPYLDEVNSLINARNTRGEGDSLIVEDLFEVWPENPIDMERKKQLALNNVFYKNLLVSEDGTITTVMIRSTAYGENSTEDEVMSGFDDEISTEESESAQIFLTDAQNTEIVNKVSDIVNKYNDDNFAIHSAGSPVVVNQIKASMQKDMQKFTMMALGSIALLLFVMFRRASGIFLPLLVVILTLASTFSLMAATNTPLKLPTQILPSFLVAVGVAASVHLLAIFFRNYNSNGNKRDAISHAMGHSGLAIAMTSLTTAAGLLSFSASEVAPIADLGKFAATGVLVSLIYTLLLLPALIAIIPLKSRSDKHTKFLGNLMDSILLWFAHISTTKSHVIIGIAALLLVIASFGLSKITFYHNPLTWLPETWEVRQATEIVDEKMRGSGFIEVVLNTGKVNGLYEPAVMQSIEKLYSQFEQIGDEVMFAGKTFSVLDILKESNRALHANDEKFYAIPADRDLIAQELLLFENSGSDDLEDFVDSQFSTARISIKTPWVDASGVANFVKEIDGELKKTLDSSVESYITGMGTLFSRTMDAAISSTKVSYVLAVLVITFMMIILLGHLKLGLVSMIPNLLPIVLSIGLMGYLSMPLDMFTLLIGSIAIGLVVDDTIHFMHNFSRYFRKYGNVEKAVTETLLGTGRAIFATTVVLCLGFFIFMAANMNNIFNFGLITGLTIILALFADLLLAPALMKVIYSKQETSTTENSQLGESRS